MDIANYLGHYFQCAFCNRSEKSFQLKDRLSENKSAFIKRCKKNGWREVVWPTGHLLFDDNKTPNPDVQGLACPQCVELWRKAAC